MAANLKYPPVLPGFSQMVHGGDYNPDQWRHMPEILEEDMRLMKKAHVNSATVGIFAWSALEPEEGKFCFDWLDKVMDRLAENGIRAILATPSGARPAWMDLKYPQVRRTERDRTLRLHGGRHNHCFTSPIFREKVNTINTLLAQRYASHPALSMWHISNEFSGECHCELCQEAFRNWLKNKYGTIEKLNLAWWNGFWSRNYSCFEEISSPAIQGENAQSGLLLDWNRFVTHQTADFIAAETAPLRRLTPNIPITTNLMRFFTQLDYARIVPLLDVVSWDDYPAWHNDWETLAQSGAEDGFCHDWFRSLGGGRPFMLMESTPSQVNWHPVNKLHRPGVTALAALNAIAHGSDSIQYFQWRKSRGADEKFHGAVVDHVGHENTRVFREVSSLGKVLENLSPVCGSTAPAKVGLIWDTQNQWAIENFQGAVKDRQYPQTCVSHYRPFWKMGVSADVLDMDADFSPYRLLIAPMLYMLRPGVADRLKAFTENGGTLVLTYLSGYTDENDLCFLGGFPGDGLMNVAGIWAEELDALYPTQFNHTVFENRTYQLDTLCELIHAKEGTEVLASYQDDFYAGRPVLTRHSFGKGQCYYLAAKPEDAFLDDFYAFLVSSLQLPKATSQKLPEGVSAVLRQNESQKFLFLLNFSEKEVTIPLDEGACFDLVTQQPVLGTCTLPVSGFAVLASDI